MIKNVFDIVLRKNDNEIINPGITVTQGDKQVNELNIRITDGLTDIDYTQVSNGTITFAKNDGNVVQGSLEKAADKFTYEMGTNEIACVGSVIASVQLFGAAGERLTSARFRFVVVRDLITPEAVASTSEFPILQQLKIDMDVIVEEFPAIKQFYTDTIPVEDARVAAENTRQSQETTRQSNENERETAESGRVNAETSRVNAENARVSSETTRQTQEAARQASIVDIENRFNQLTAQQQQEAEVIDARQGYSSLGANLTAFKADYATLSEEVHNPTYSAENTFTTPVYGMSMTTIKSIFEEFILRGNTVQNIVVNGNFANGTTGWIASNSTNMVNSNVLTNTANGSSNIGRVRQIMPSPYITGHKYYVTAKLKVTNSVCSSFYVILGDDPAINYETFSVVTNPEQNKEYKASHIFTGKTNDTVTSLIIDHNYADAATANGKVMEVKEVMAIDLTAIGLDTLTAADCNKRFPHYIDGLKGTGSQKVTVTGRNIWGSKKAADDIVKAVNNSTYAYLTTVDGRNCVELVGSDIILKKKLPIVFDLNTQYSFQFYAKNNGATGGIFDIFYTDGTHSYAGANIITSTWTKITALSIAGKTISYITTTYQQSGGAITYIDYDTIMINEGVDTLYEPYSPTTVTTPEVGYRLPNNVCDEIDILKGVKPQNINKKVMLSSDILSVATGTNVDFAICTIFENQKIITGGSSNIGNFYIEFIYEIPNSGFDNLDNIGKFFISTTGKLCFVVEKGTTLAQAQTVFAGKTLLYQLATPIISPCDSKQLIAEPNGQISATPYIADIAMYTNKITITTATNPAKSIDFVTLINRYGVAGALSTPIDISKVHLAADGITATIDGALVDDWYEFGAEAKLENSTVGTITESHATNLKGQTDSLTKGMSELDKKADALSTKIDVAQEQISAHNADYIRYPPYAPDTGTANHLIITLNPAPTAYTDGMGIVVKVKNASSAATDINVNGLGVKGVVDIAGNAVTNLRANGIYTMRYEVTADKFILQ